MNGVAYNERSWAIDLIAHIKNYLAGQNRSVKDAGGEQTVRANGGSLFPDVLLFGDQTLALILQGWELKMPDTSIDDPDFRTNAIAKADALGLDSFVLWNASVARLFIRVEGTSHFNLEREWDDLLDLRDRQAVANNRQRWQAVANEIIDYINDLFDRNTIVGRPFVKAYESGGITSLIMANAASVADTLRNTANRNVRLNSEIVIWWELYQAEYGGNDPYPKLAQANISNWIGKLLFAHILQSRDQRAQVVTRISEDITPQQALEIFTQLSETCDFWTIFSSDAVGLSIIPERTWSQLCQLNRLLTDIRIAGIDQNQLSHILEATVNVAVRKLRGQYPTPPVLARLLVQLTMQNVIDDRVLDPCCGSGTIARAALERKLEADVDPVAAASTVFAGDNDPLAVQIATFALTRPELMNTPLRIFKHDAFSLEPTTELNFRNPNDGTPFIEEAGIFNAIASNLPFVAQDGRANYGNAINRVSELFNEDGDLLPQNSDVAAYLPFSLYSLLADGGRLGVIITNAWLGTAWGDAFRDRLGRYYRLRRVITSGAGRWFQNSKVVTNILILEKTTLEIADEASLDFIVLKEPIGELSDMRSLAVVAAQIERGQAHDETLMIRSVSFNQLDRFRVLGLAGNAQFVDCDWILELPLVPVSDLFDVVRGERRGWNAMFYPAAGHGIEAEYIVPLLKSPKDATGYTAAAQKEAFCCSASIEQLEENGHLGALAWIRKFEAATNTDGTPLVESLARANLFWYEMRADKLADIVMPLNPGNRLFVSRLIPPVFVDQRLTCLTAKEGVEIDLGHALLNTAVSMFIIEGMGFGRGEGVLDLSKNRVDKFMHMLDPRRLNDEQADRIKAAFAPLLTRDVLQVADELECRDRQHFDDVVIEEFGLNIERETVYESLRQLFAIRETALDSYE